MIRLHFRSGALAGRVFEFEAGPVRIGRQPGLEVSLDPERDLAVSGVHAQLDRTSHGWILRDLESRNGTWLDGRRIEGPTPVTDGVRIRLGEDGPELQLGVGAAPHGSATARVRSAVEGVTRRYRTRVALSVLTLAGVTVAFLVRGHARESSWEAERHELMVAADRVLAGDAARVGAGSQREAVLEGELAALGEALSGARAEVRALRDSLEWAGRASPAGSSREAELRRRLQDATAELQQQRMASRLDFDAIRAANVRAVALVFVESGDGRLSTGSAFAIRSSGVLVTVRHLVLPELDGVPPSRIGVQFAGSTQVFPARIAAVAADDDLVALRIENLVGTVPIVAGLNARLDTLAPGAPLASLGFPLGADHRAPSEAGNWAPRPVLTAGVLMAVRPDRIEVRGYGEPGASGSPIFDGDGRVVGVLYGGRSAGPEATVLAVNGARLARFVARLP